MILEFMEQLVLVLLRKARWEPQQPGLGHERLQEKHEKEDKNCGNKP